MAKTRPTAFIGGPHDGRVLEMPAPDDPRWPIMFDTPGKVRHTYVPTGCVERVLPGCKNACTVYNYTHAGSETLRV